jgi:hypothetical protein
MRRKSMSDRKYRQRGYQDDDRDRQPRPQGPRPAPEPQSVSLDFKSGMKTTLFSDGSTVTEPFDTAALKGLAAAPAEGRPAR